jgi:predicted dehydrogenase
MGDVPMRAVGIRVGVVEVGYWGTKHVRVLHSTTGVASVIGIDQQFAQIGDCREEPKHGITAYADIEDALPHVDAVAIATPPTSHASLALRAISAGKHVLIEKPRAMMAVLTSCCATREQMEGSAERWSVRNRGA